MELALPVASTGDEDIDQETPRVTINVKPDGTMWLAGRLVNREQLPNRLQTIKNENDGAIEVRIRGSRKAPYASVAPIMVACTKSGIWNVKYAVYGEEQR